MMPTPLILGPDEKAKLQALRELAARHPVDMTMIQQRLGTQVGKRKHMRQMSKQTVYLPADFAVTFSIKIIHPTGTYRHMSLSVGPADRLPAPESLWMVAEELGFVGGLHACSAVWAEEVQGHGQAINIVQSISTMPTHGTA